MKYKLLLIIALLFIYASSCEDEPEAEPFDYAAQAIKDNDSLVKYFQTHFINAENELEIVTEETENVTLLIDDNELKNTTVTLEIAGEDIDYKLYYYLTNHGVNDKPARVDKAHISYTGMKLDHEVFDSNNYGKWWDLYTEPIKGWSYGLIYFESGNANLLPDDTVEYTDMGTGYLFMPSGLAYHNSTSLANQCLIFSIKMNDVFHQDHDDDNVLSKDEDLNGDGYYRDDDTDGDEIPNFIDNDDDGDGTLTKDEDANENGDPTDDFNGTDPSIPDYLNPDIK
jgi:hypothetical protein